MGGQMKITVEDAELFIDAYVKVKDYYAKVMRVYDNGILTSAGFVQEAEFDEAHATIDTVDADVVYCSFAALHLPPDWHDRLFKCAVFVEGSFSGEQKIVDIDLQMAAMLEGMDCPYIDTAPPVFEAEDGLLYDMVKLCINPGQS